METIDARGLGTIVLCTALLAGPAAIAAGSKASRIEGEPRAMVTWNPGQIAQIVSPGETRRVTVSVAALRDIRRAAVRFSAEVAAFVHAEPPLVQRVRKGQAFDLQFVISVSTAAPAGAIKGTAALVRVDFDEADHAGDDGDDTRDDDVLEPLLPIGLRIWARVAAAPSGVSIAVPPITREIRLSTVAINGRSFVELDVADSTATAFVPTFRIRLFPNGDRSALGQWFDANVDVAGILAASGTFAPRQLDGGNAALVRVGSIPVEFLDVGGPVDEAYLISVLADRVVSFSISQDNELTELGYSGDTLTRLIVDLIETIRF
jgi:hypothetical protein